MREPGPAADRQRRDRGRPRRAARGCSPASRTTAAAPTSAPAPSRSAGCSRASATTASDGLEGVRRDNLIGTYLHGPLLPKNAWLADHLIALALGAPLRRRARARAARRHARGSRPRERPAGGAARLSFARSSGRGHSLPGRRSFPRGRSPSCPKATIRCSSRSTTPTGRSTALDHVLPDLHGDPDPDRARRPIGGGSREASTPAPTSLAAGGSGLLFFPPLLMILFRRKYPRWWFDWNLELLRFSNRVGVYLALMDDRYPSTDEQQSVHLDFPYPDARARPEPLAAAGQVVPGHPALHRARSSCGSPAFFCVVIAWFAILFTGRYPRGLFDHRRERHALGQPRRGLRVPAGHRPLPAVQPQLSRGMAAPLAPADLSRRWLLSDRWSRSHLLPGRWRSTRPPRPPRRRQTASRGAARCGLPDGPRRRDPDRCSRAAR